MARKIKRFQRTVVVTKSELITLLLDFLEPGLSANDISDLVLSNFDSSFVDILVDQPGAVASDVDESTSYSYTLQEFILRCLVPKDPSLLNKTMSNIIPDGPMDFLITMEPEIEFSVPD